MPGRGMYSTVRSFDGLRLDGTVVVPEGPVNRLSFWCMAVESFARRRVLYSARGRPGGDWRGVAALRGAWA